MDIGQALRMAVRNLGANKTRCMQALLGMIIGVAAAVVILCIGSGIFQQIQACIRQYDDNLIYMSTFTHHKTGKYYPTADIEQVLADNPGLCGAFSPVVDDTFLSRTSVADKLDYKVKYGNTVYDDLAVCGVSEDFLQTVTALHLQEGRFLEPMDIEREQNVCVLGSTAVEEIFGGEALGQTVKINGYNYTVVGQLAEAPQTADADWNGLVYVPYSILERQIQAAWIDAGGGQFFPAQYYLNATGEENVAALSKALSDGLEAIYGEDRILVGAMSMKSVGEGDVGALMQMLVLPFVGAVLIMLVGGVGIMNVMLASVKERTKEIGIRKACGATNREIARQFRLEAVITSLGGGLLGIAAGLPLSLLAMRLIGGITLMYSGETYPLDGFAPSQVFIPILAALVFSVGVGVIFGSAPAAEAAKMQPVEAINSD